jgi:hypothetical protein
MPRREHSNGALWWIAVGVVVVVMLLLFAALQWNYLPRSWRGFAWLAFVGLPAWLLFEWMGDSLQEKLKGRSGWSQALAILALIVVVALIVWLMPAAPR